MWALATFYMTLQWGHGSEAVEMGRNGLLWGVQDLLQWGHGLGAVDTILAGFAGATVM